MFVETNPVQAGSSLTGREGGRVGRGCLSLGGREGDSVC